MNEAITVESFERCFHYTSALGKWNIIIFVEMDPLLQTVYGEMMMQI